MSSYVALSTEQLELWNVLKLFSKQNVIREPECFTKIKALNSVIPAFFPDITNQVPLVTCISVLQPVTEQTGGYDEEAETAAALAKIGFEERSSTALSRASIDTSKFYPLSKRRGPDVLKQIFVEMAKKFDAYSKSESHEQEGTAEFEPEVDQVVTSVPMTWPMMSEIDEESVKKSVPEDKQSKAKPKRVFKKTKIRQQRASVDSARGTPTLSVTSKQKEQKDILAEAAAAALGYFSLIRPSDAARTSLQPAMLGIDDTSKSAQDLTEESANIAGWERSRSASVISRPSTSFDPDPDV
ncbi:hypothetical protein RRG08_048896 [Elysia crispata]|uniref:Uncharacterized protein n=1 Tax=Elysia crispata TaxID=231223 RepID=A0AAE0YTX3_9GAST|nr:hypothetical protein RRG08_048896 [Elysia crispata]